MERVSVQGVPGSGKSTVGRAVAARLGLPYVELDALHHGPNWSVRLIRLRSRRDVQRFLRTLDR